MNNKSKIQCPSCSVLMQIVITKSHYDVPIVVEQCPNCGGIWFNDMEFHKVKLGEASRIEVLNKKKFQKPFLLKSISLYCPKDGSTLIQFKDLNFPKGIIIEKCSTCNGFWFNCGELVEFQNKIQRKREIEKSKTSQKNEFENQIIKILENSSDSEKNNTLRKFSSFLSTPIDRISNHPHSSDPSAQNSNKVINTAFGILQFMLSLFLP